MENNRLIKLKYLFDKIKLKNKLKNEKIILMKNKIRLLPKNKKQHSNINNNNKILNLNDINCKNNTEEFDQDIYLNMIEKLKINILILNQNIIIYKRGLNKLDYNKDKTIIIKQNWINFNTKINFFKTMQLNNYKYETKEIFKKSMKIKNKTKFNYKKLITLKKTVNGYNKLVNSEKSRLKNIHSDLKESNINFIKNNNFKKNLKILYSDFKILLEINNIFNNKLYYLKNDYYKYFDNYLNNELSLECIVNNIINSYREPIIAKKILFEKITNLKKSILISSSKLKKQNKNLEELKNNKIKEYIISSHINKNKEQITDLNTYNNKYQTKIKNMEKIFMDFRIYIDNILINFINLVLFICSIIKKVKFKNDIIKVKIKKIIDKSALNFIDGKVSSQYKKNICKSDLIDNFDNVNIFNFFCETTIWLFYFYKKNIFNFDSNKDYSSLIEIYHLNYTSKLQNIFDNITSVFKWFKFKKFEKIENYIDSLRSINNKFNIKIDYTKTPSTKNKIKIKSIILNSSKKSLNKINNIEDAKNIFESKFKSIKKNNNNNNSNRSSKIKKIFQNTFIIKKIKKIIKNNKQTKNDNLDDHYFKNIDKVQYKKYDTKNTESKSKSKSNITLAKSIFFDNKSMIKFNKFLDNINYCLFSDKNKTSSYINCYKSSDQIKYLKK